jgi:hypothetical protein
MMHRVRSLVTVLALASPAIARADADAEIRAYGSSPYTYCDAKLLAGLWRQAVGDAKLQIGRKLIDGEQDALVAGIADARRRASANPKLRCTFAEAGFSFADAQKLAKVWKTTTADAKARAEAKIVGAGGEATVRSLLQGEDLYAFTAKYSYCDGKVLAGYWRQSIAEAKALAGSKLRANHGAALETALVEARKQAASNPRQRCSYHEAGFTFADAQKLAKLWKRSTADAKSMIEVKLLAPGGDALLRQLLSGKPAAPPPTQPPPQTQPALPPQANSYTYCDAKLLSAAWKQSLAEAKALAADKVAAGNAASVEAALDQGRKLASRNKKLRCGFAEAGFTFDDAEVLAKLWSSSTAEAKAVVEDKLLFRGGEARVRAQLAQKRK